MQYTGIHLHCVEQIHLSIMVQVLWLPFIRLNTAEYREIFKRKGFSNSVDGEPPDDLLYQSDQDDALHLERTTWRILNQIRTGVTSTKVNKVKTNRFPRSSM